MTPPTLAEALDEIWAWFEDGTGLDASAYAESDDQVRYIRATPIREAALRLAREISAPSAATVELVARALGLASFSASHLDEATRRALVDDHWRSHIHQARAVLQALAEMGGE